MNKILCIGEALIDMICTNKGTTLNNGENFIKKAGGAPTNVAAAIAALGGKVDLAAKVGADPFGNHLIEVMKSFGVGTKFIVQDPNHFTTFAFVSLMKNGERDFYFNRGADGELSIADIKNIQLKHYPIIHFGSATGFLPGKLQKTYLSLFKQANDNNQFICFDPNYRHLLFQNNQKSFIQLSLKFIQQCQFFKVSDEEALLITNTTNLNDAANILISKTKAIFAITLGAKGTLLSVNGEIIIIPSIKVKPKDTTGAGDAFVGAVIYQLSLLKKSQLKEISKETWIEIIRKANKAGARTCEFFGAMEAFKNLDKTILN